LALSGLSYGPRAGIDTRSGYERVSSTLMGASFSVYQQPDESWAWRILEEGRRHIMCTNPGYATACEAAEAAVAILGGTYARLAVRLAASYQKQHS